LRRRDAEDLVLMSAGRAQQEGEVVDLTARLLAGMLKEHGGAELSPATQRNHRLGYAGTGHPKATDG
jgi:hypothetical protein